MYVVAIVNAGARRRVPISANEYFDFTLRRFGRDHLYNRPSGHPDQPTGHDQGECGPAVTAVE